MCRFNIIGQSDSEYLILENGYKYLCKKRSLSVFKASLRNILPESYLDYLNKEEFAEYPLEAITTDLNRVLIRNTNNGNITWARKFHITPSTLLRTTSLSEEYVSRLKESLGDFYDYSKCTPNSTTDNVIIGCPIHGEFTIRVDNAIYGSSSCPHCVAERVFPTKKNFSKALQQNDSEGYIILYTIQDLEEDTIHINIHLSPKLSIIPKLPQKFKVLDMTSYSASAETLYNTFISIQKKYRHMRNIPKTSFPNRGSSFNPSIKEEFLNILRSL